MSKSDAETTAEDRAWFAFRARIASCLWAAMAEAGKSPEDVAAALGMPARRVRRIVHADKAGCSSAELAVIAHYLGFEWQFGLASPTQPEPAADA